MDKAELNKEQSGFLLIDKSKGWTSFDVVAKLRGITKIKKIGHAGTLDPLATGLLIVAVGRQATRQIDTFVKLDKVYETTGILGAVSESYDADGTIYRSESNFTKKQGWCIADNVPTEENLRNVIMSFLGEQEQVPPMFSAKKVNGKKLYELARKGETIKRKASKIIIHQIELLRYKYPEFDLRIQCSSGTYIRTIVHDIGQQLGTGAYVNMLRRTQIGNFNVDNAVQLVDITFENYSEKFVK